MNPFVPQLINLFATLILMLSFAMISQRRITSLINLFLMQGAALVAALPATMPCPPAPRWRPT